MNHPTAQNTRVRNLGKKRERLADKPLKVAPRRAKSSRHRFPAHVTEENQWQSGDAPQAKSSRTFAWALAVHLVAVGGLVGFHFFGNDPAEKEVAKSAEKKASSLSSGTTASASKSAAPASTSATIPSAVAASPIDPVISPESTPLPPGYKEHIVRFDENWDSIAASNAITVDDLQNANPGIEFNVGRLLRVPPAGNRITSGNTFTAKTSLELKPEARRLPDNARGNAQIHYAPNLDKANLLTADTSAPSPSVTPPRSAVTTSLNGKTSAGAKSAASSNKVASASASSKGKDTGKALKASGVDVSRPKTSTVSKGGSHTVASGDTIYSIAKARGVSAKQLMKANGITDAGKLKKGQKLKVPADN